MSNTKLFIGNLSFQATEEDIKALFSDHGEVREVKIVTDRYTGRPRGFAFVEMATSDNATSARKALDGQQFQGRDLSVDVARAREPGQGQPRERSHSGDRRDSQY